MRVKRQKSRSLDQIDKQILSILQKDARISMKDLADEVGLSTTPCIERVSRLQQEGIIIGYYAHVNPHMVDASLLVFVELSLEAKSGQKFHALKQAIIQLPQILECHLISGEFDYLVKARIKDIGEYRHLLGILLDLPGVVQSKSSIVMEEIKEVSSLAIA